MYVAIYANLLENQQLRNRTTLALAAINPAYFTLTTCRGLELNVGSQPPSNLITTEVRPLP